MTALKVYIASSIGLIVSILIFMISKNYLIKLSTSISSILLLSLMIYSIYLMYYEDIYGKVRRKRKVKFIEIEVE